MTLPYGFHEGNRSEYMALFALSNLGFCTPVPRQEDHFLADFIVHLATGQESAFVASGRCFAIQVKSDRQPLRYDDKRKARCINGLTIPFFLGVVSKEQQSLSVYSTLTRLCHMWRFGREVPVELTPGQEGENVPMPDWENHRVPLGGPVAKVCLAELDNPDTKVDVRAGFHDVMSYWIKLEEAALAWKEHAVPLVFWQTEHRPNEVPDPKKQQPWVAANPRSLPAITRAVWHYLLSYDYYLQDTLTRAEREELPLSTDTLDKVRRLKQLVESLADLSGKVVAGMGEDLGVSAG